MARKPLIGTVAENLAMYGTGAINISACRVPVSDADARDVGREITRNVRGLDDGWGMNAGETQTAVQVVRPEGRWPANLLLSDSDEVRAAFPDSAGQQGDVIGTEPSGVTDEIYGKFKGRVPSVARNDSGSAARFFYQAEKDDRCELCDVNIAVSRSPTGTILPKNSAGDVAQDSHLPGSEDKDRPSNSLANSAARNSRRCHPMTPSIAVHNAPTPLQQKIAQNVLSAANLCGSCATGIAQEIVAASRFEPLGSSPSLASIDGFKKTILLRCLASYVESRENTDTILTTTNLRELFGCVFHAIAENTNSEKAGSWENTNPAPKRLWYGAKASKADREEGCDALDDSVLARGNSAQRQERDGEIVDEAGGGFNAARKRKNNHPTVKPTALMAYLCRLVTPPGGLVLDPFMGSGSTGKAAVMEGFRFIGIEREANYMRIAEARVASGVTKAAAARQPGVRDRKRVAVAAGQNDLFAGAL